MMVMNMMMMMTIDHQHVRHFNFLDFEALGQAAPTWINIVRDPVRGSLY